MDFQNTRRSSSAPPAGRTSANIQCGYCGSSNKPRDLSSLKATLPVFPSSVSIGNPLGPTLLSSCEDLRHSRSRIPTTPATRAIVTSNSKNNIAAGKKLCMVDQKTTGGRRESLPNTHTDHASQDLARNPTFQSPRARNLNQAGFEEMDSPPPRPPPHRFLKLKTEDEAPPPQKRRPTPLPLRPYQDPENLDRNPTPVISPRPLPSPPRKSWHETSKDSARTRPVHGPGVMSSRNLAPITSPTQFLMPANTSPGASRLEVESPNSRRGSLLTPRKSSLSPHPGQSLSKVETGHSNHGSTPLLSPGYGSMRSPRPRPEIPSTTGLGISGASPRMGHSSGNLSPMSPGRPLSPIASHSPGRNDSEHEMELQMGAASLAEIQTVKIPLDKRIYAWIENVEPPSRIDLENPAPKFPNPTAPSSIAALSSMAPRSEDEIPEPPNHKLENLPVYVGITPDGPQHAPPQSNAHGSTSNAAMSAFNQNRYRRSSDSALFGRIFPSRANWGGTLETIPSSAAIDTVDNGLPEEVDRMVLSIANISGLDFERACWELTPKQLDSLEKRVRHQANHVMDLLQAVVKIRCLKVQGPEPITVVGERQRRFSTPRV
ncbi:hypothetical protein DFH27DRAFT_531872 [Peziza echinospora]|nr:hypothetical protein DFH27DRAFT_531872 [Peziza echinospora]